MLLITPGIYHLRKKGVQLLRPGESKTTPSISTLQRVQEAL